MEYVALYRKYRPKRFEDMIGQENVVSILKNQITMDKIAHAYLFSGTRGTGKTSAAKIFARAVNCPESETGEPCNNCKTCADLETSSVMDIIEIDAASNRGVDEIRDLRDKVKYMPAVGRYKVYIIDEVHMLTMEAFNALLKTLEEPPAHAIFILATTEPNKLPATILSRCQRFNFRRLTSEEIIGRMAYICKDTQIEIEDAALKLIARNADGAMRDALSILDQCMSISKDDLIEYEEVKSILGITDNEIVYSMIEAVLDRDVKRALDNLDNAYNAGKEMVQLIHQLISGFRDVLIYGITKNTNMLIEIKDESSGLLAGSSMETMERISSIIDVLTDRENKLKFTALPKILMEVTLVRLCTMEESTIKASSTQVEKPARQAPVAREQEAGYVRKDPQAHEKISDGPKPGKDADFASVVKYISKDKKVLGMSLGVGKAKADGDKIIIRYNQGDEFHSQKVEEEKAYIESTAKKILGRDVKISIQVKTRDDYLVNKLPLDLFGEDKVEFK
ncbi:DNA polymerase III subunit gamma/tau [Alkalibacter saccharofermentans]|uniref:DNA-directed DNA polymerase n=1 Tax=Alkalibacter saccharofermentans DSM 14828 TaxID=1120975 RepID=A0A1M4V3Q8_9FIRM|nr:DNA polymerase III subunit gamma/tau [Alkalibacter saccharofermentans]SHE63616.1 DNA polymerase-3 subunit gamma/tau [Alkalibacter saccharofermentans DSM 14828]